MKNFFDIIAPIYEKIHSGAEKIFKKLESITYFQSSDNVLDLGGGTGRISKFLANKVKKIVVVDSSQNMIGGCKKHAGLFCVFAQAEELPFSEQSFNKIIVINAFHHFQNQKQVIKEMKRVLANDGRVVIEEFNPVKMFGKLIVIIEKMFCLGSHFHSPISLINLFSMNGFKARIVNENKSTYYLIAEKLTNSL